jgi:osmoprotectant transport system ATP-binding protein
VFDLRGVWKRFGRVQALHGIDLQIEPGHTTVLIGPSGCGKSSLLRVLLGLVAPDEGEARFDGAAITPDRIPALRRRTGYVVQDGGLFPHLTAYGNVVLVARHLGWTVPRIEARVSELLELVRLERAALDRFPLELSGGQRQRVALMRALMLDPDVLLLDEPLGALDPMIRSDLQSDLRDVFARLVKTVVLVTHDLGEAAFFGGTAVLMNDGRVVQSGAIAELVRHPADPFVTRFVHAQRQLTLEPA